MNKQLIFFAALNIAFLTSCGSEAKKQAGEEYYDSAYRAKSDSAFTASEEERAQAQTETNSRDTNSEKVGENASTHSAASEAPAAENDKSQASSPAKTAEMTPAKDNAAVAKPETKPVAATGNFDKGKALLAKSDCLACHKLDQKVVGPAYQDVAKKYEANEKNIAYLANKIIKGGAGAWGDIPMSPHPTLPQGDAREMAKYILSLR